jgi:hypothetical protein
MGNMPTAPTQADFERVTALAHDLAMKAQETFKESALSPLLALAALSKATCQVAIVTDTTYITLMELIGVHFQAAGIELSLQELEDQRKKGNRS